MTKRIPEEIINQIKSLREKGLSLPEIKKKIPIGQATIYRYVKDVTILPQYEKAWRNKRASSRKRKRLAEIKALKKAKKLIKSLSKKEKSIFLATLYWGEGTKNDFGLSNTDPHLIQIFVKGLQEVFGIPKDRLRISIRLYEDIDKELSLQFWSEITGVPSDKFVSINVLKGKKHGKLPYGMCRVRVQKGGDMLKYVMALKERIITLF